MKRIKRINYLFIITISGLAITACSQDYLESDKRSNEEGLVLNFAPATYASGSEAVMSGLRLYAFQRGGNGDGYFSHQIPVVSQTTNTLKGKIRVGDWYMNMVALQDVNAASNSYFTTTSDYTFQQPVYANPMQDMEMYTWNPSSAGLDINSHEIWFQSQSLPTIEPDQSYNVETTLARNNTLINLDISFPYENYNVGGDNAESVDGAILSNTKISKVEFRNMPSVISWDGQCSSTTDVTLPVSDLLPPEACSTYEKDGVIWQKVQYKGWYIPAHRGSDFWLSDGKTLNPLPTDTLTTKPILDITILGTYTKKDGSTFEKTFQFSKEIPIVPKCNMQLNINAILQSAYEEIDISVQQWALETIDVPVSSDPVTLNVFPGSLYGINGEFKGEVDFYVKSNSSISKMSFINSWSNEEVPIGMMPAFYSLDDGSFTCTIYRKRLSDGSYLVSVAMTTEENYGDILAGLRFEATSENGLATVKQSVWFYPD